jgi:hypothetical protein
MDAAGDASGILSSIGLGKIPASAQLFIAGAVLLHLLVLVFWLFRLVSRTMMYMLASTMRRSLS